MSMIVVAVVGFVVYSLLNAGETAQAAKDQLKYSVSSSIKNISMAGLEIEVILSLFNYSDSVNFSIQYPQVFILKDGSDFAQGEMRAEMINLPPLSKAQVPLRFVVSLTSLAGLLFDIGVSAVPVVNAITSGDYANALVLAKGIQPQILAKFSARVITSFNGLKVNLNVPLNVGETDLPNQ